MLFRSIGLTESDLAEIRDRTKLLKAAPADDSFLMKAFNKNKDAAEGAYSSPFIDGIRTGTLSPDRYGAVNVMDAYYCYEAAKSIWDACRKSKKSDAGLYVLQSKLYNGYATYNSTFYTHWHVLTSKSVSPTENFRRYAQHERKVAETEEPIYLLPALLPCYYLWYWMADKIDKDASAAPGVYREWVDGNKYEPHSAYLINDFITQWQKDGKPWDEGKAMKIFADSMECERRVFNECGYQD